MDIPKTILEILEQFWISFRSWPVVIASVVIAFALLVMTFVVGMLIPSAQAGDELPTAVLKIIPGPTSTQFAPTATTTRVPSVTPNMPPSPMPGMIGVGSYVQIFGTEGSGLNIRKSAGLSSEVNFLAYDSEVFEVRDGPVVVNDLTWWFIVTPVDEARSGWAAANYLTIVNEP